MSSALNQNNAEICVLQCVSFPQTPRLLQTQSLPLCSAPRILMGESASEPPVNGTGNPAESRLIHTRSSRRRYGAFVQKFKKQQLDDEHEPERKADPANGS